MINLWLLIDGNVAGREPPESPSFTSWQHSSDGNKQDGDDSRRIIIQLADLVSYQGGHFA